MPRTSTKRALSSAVEIVPEKSASQCSKTAHSLLSSIFAVLRTAPPQRGVMGSFFVGLLEVAPIFVSSVEATAESSGQRLEESTGQPLEGRPCLV